VRVSQQTRSNNDDSSVLISARFGITTDATIHDVIDNKANQVQTHVPCIHMNIMALHNLVRRAEATFLTANLA
jgi:hypothetical protein